MNYYDYRSYFQQITGDLDNIQSKQDDLQASVNEIKTTFGEKLDLINSSITATGLILSVVLIISLCFKVFFK